MGDILVTLIVVMLFLVIAGALCAQLFLSVMPRSVRQFWFAVSIEVVADIVYGMLRAAWHTVFGAPQVRMSKRRGGRGRRRRP